MNTLAHLPRLDRMAYVSSERMAVRRGKRPTRWQEYRALVAVAIAAALVMGVVVVGHSAAWPQLHIEAKGDDGEKFAVTITWADFGASQPARRCEQFRDRIGAQIGQTFTVEKQACTP